MAFVFGAIDECKTDVYFGNGILTEEEDAEKNARLLEDAIIEKFGLNYFQTKIGKVDYAYNDTFGFGWDILESYSQIVNTQGFKDWWVNHLLPGNKQTAHQANIDKQVDAYEASIKDGHRVLVVAHSQGNLFAQEAYETLGERSANQDHWLQKYWEAVSIASPDRTTDIITPLMNSLNI
jgi:hypothetical protein